MPPLNITDTAVPRPKVPLLGRTPAMRSSSRYSNFKLPIKKAPKEPSDTRSSTVLRLLVFGDTQTTLESPRTSPATTAVPKWHDTVPASPCILPYIDTVTVVPPPTEAILGVTDEIPRPPSNVSCMLDSPVSTPLLLTLTRTVPAPLVGAMHFTMDDEAYTALTVVFTPILQLNPSVCSKCRPTTVITWFAAPATANEGRRLSTTGSSCRNKVCSPTLWSTVPFTLSCRYTLPGDANMGDRHTIRALEIHFAGTICPCI